MQRFNFKLNTGIIFHNRSVQKVLTPIIISLVAGDLTAGDFFPTSPTVVFLWKTDDLRDQGNSKFTAQHISLLQNFFRYSYNRSSEWQLGFTFPS